MARNPRRRALFYLYGQSQNAKAVAFALGSQGTVRRRAQGQTCEEDKKPKQEKIAMRMKVDHNQFETCGDKRRHAPTDALLWPGENDVVTCEFGLAGTRTGAGDDYDVEQLKQAAWEIFKLQKSTRL